MKKNILLLLLLTFLTVRTLTISGQETGIDKKMQWFKDARLGIFIHWGIYALNGIDESWSDRGNREKF